LARRSLVQAIPQALSARTVGAPIIAQNLAVFPLTGAPASPLKYLTLADAISGGRARVREVSDAGVVREILFENLSDQAILILDGEELVGAKQNRTVNVTILAPAGKTLTIPVTCIEAGRWASRSYGFNSAERAHFARGRAAKMQNVTDSMALHQSRAADQSAVWDAIAAKSERMQVRSPTSALSDVFESHRSHVEDYVGAFEAAPEQTGAIFAIDGRVEGLEVFDAAATFARLLPMLVRSYAIDALETASRPAKVAVLNEAEAFVERLANAESSEYDALGLGREIRVNTADIVAAGLVVEDVLVHLAAFRKETSATRPQGTRQRMQSARVRQRSLFSS
jgi:hypothetical protein